LRNETTETLFRGANHTTLGGAIYYASYLKSFIKPIIEKSDANKHISIFNQGLSRFTSLSLPIDLPDLRTNITSISFRLSERLELELAVTVIFPLIVGPFSPVLEISIKNFEQSILLRNSTIVWDRYCHYERQTLFPVQLKLPIGSRRIDFAISRLNPNYESSNNPDFNYSSFRNISARFLRFYDQKVYIVSQTVDFDIREKMVVLLNT